MNKGIKQLLAISIAINLLLLGAVGGHLVKKKNHQPPHKGHIEDAVEALSEDKQLLFHQTMRAMKQHQDALDSIIRKQTDNVVHSLEQEPFNEQAFQSAIDELHHLRGKQVQHLANSAKKLAAQFNKKERRILAELLRRPPPPHRDGEGRPAH